MFCGKIRGSSEIIYGVFRNNTNLLFNKRESFVQIVWKR